jgi:hypothetical protein
LNRGLNGKYIQTSTRDAAFVQSLGKIGFHDQGTATCIQEESGFLHQSEALEVDKATSLRCKRTMKRDYVAISEESLNRNCADVRFSRVRTTGGCKDVHAERARDTTDLRADTAVSNDAEIQACEFDERKIPVTEIRAGGPASVANGLGVVSDSIGKF